jgi:iron complex transport system ATP-binding protein
MLSVRNLSFSYGTHDVLRDVSFDAPVGQMLAVLGPNGVGKSTLFRCMLGLETRYRGEITLGGKPIRSISPRQLAQQIAYVPQSHSPSFNYSVFDMVLMGTTARVGLLNSPREAQIAVTEQSLERVGILHLRDRGYLRISGGERQLTLIARALAQQASVVIMDEPTASLDYGNGLRVLKQVRDLAREGLTVVQSTHNPDHAFMFADQVLAMVDGAVAAFGTPDETLDEPMIEALYGIRAKLRHVDGVTSVQPIF